MADKKSRNTLHLLATSSETTALDAARNLLANGEDVSAKSDEGLTPLHVACAYDCLAMAQLLMHYGASPHIEDNYGRTPYSMATGNTQRFLHRMLSRTTKEQRGIIRRLFACHNVVEDGHKKTCFLRSIRRKIQRSLDVISRRSRSRSDALPVKETTQTLLDVPSTSVSNQPCLHTADPVYPLVDIMPKPSLLRELKIEGNNKSHKTSTALPNTESPVILRRKDEHPTTTSRMDGYSEKIGHADEVSSCFSRNNISQETEDSEVYLTADESFDFSDLQRRLEQIKIHDPILSPCVDDGYLRKVRRLNDAELKAELKKVGILAGPICARTRKLYEKKLVSVKRGIDEVRGVKYSRQLEKTIMGLSPSELGKLLDVKVREEFRHHGVNAFCYLLLDPRKISQDVELLDLKSFVSSIFYVGKGSKLRPFAHLLEAKKVKESQSPKMMCNAKLQRINSIWDSGRGVVCLQISHNISDDEAFVREAALIDAIKIDNLTNVKAGEYRGRSKLWTLPMKSEFGAYQLERAWGVLKMEGIRPIMPQSLPDSQFSFAPKRN